MFICHDVTDSNRHTEQHQLMSYSSTSDWFMCVIICHIHPHACLSFIISSSTLDHITRYLVHYKLHIPKFYCRNKIQRKSERDINIENQCVSARSLERFVCSLAYYTSRSAMLTRLNTNGLATAFVFSNIVWPIKRCNAAAQNKMETNCFGGQFSYLRAFAFV